jgi:hypothetical protein
MDIRKIEMMRQLQREYYDEKKRKVRYVSVNVQVLFMYRLCLLFVIGFFIVLVLGGLP